MKAARDWWRDISDVAVTARVTAAVTGLFAPPEWATFHEVEVPAVGGGGCTRRADVLAVHCWAVRGPGPHVEGVEVKASLSDLRRELADERKTEATAQYCARMWFALPGGLIDLAEIPARWGVIEVDDAGQARRARKPADRADVKNMSHNVVASLARRACRAMAPEGVTEMQGAKRPGDTWRCFWRVAGRDLTFHEVVDLAKAAYAGTVRGMTAHEIDRRLGELAAISAEVQAAVHQRGAWYGDATTRPGALMRWADDQRAAVERAQRERDAARTEALVARRDRSDTQDWYAARWERLRDLLRGTEFEDTACAIMANGTGAPGEPPTYAQTINQLRSLERWCQDNYHLRALVECGLLPSRRPEGQS